MTSADLAAKTADVRSELLEAVERAVREASAEEGHATVQSILDWLGPDALERVRDSYKTDLQTSVGNLCRALVRQDRISSLGFVGRVRAYAPKREGRASTAVTTDSNSPLSERAPLSRRSYLLGVIRELCVAWRGAIRVGQIRAALLSNGRSSSHGTGDDQATEEYGVRASLLKGTNLASTIASLSATRHVLRAGRVRGRRSGGIDLWVPSDFPGGLPAPYAAAPEHVRPPKQRASRPGTTSQQVRSAVHALVERSEWRLVTTRQVGKALPPDYRGRESKFGRKTPASKHVDSALRIAQTERQVFGPNIARVGHVGGVVYYTTVQRLEEGRAALAVKELFTRYSEDALRDALGAARRIASTALFSARTAALRGELRRAIAMARDLDVNIHLGESVRVALKRYQERLTVMASQLMEEREARGACGDTTTKGKCVSVPVLGEHEVELVSLRAAAAFASVITAGSVAPPTPENLAKSIAALSVRADASGARVLRERRPFGSGTEARFDAVSVRILVALRYAGHETRRQARIAEFTLGSLRDERVLLNALAEPTIDAQLEAIAGLAFLRTPRSIAALRARVLNDRSSSIRELAVWGCGVAGADDAGELAARLATDDPDAYVRTSAAEYLRILETDVRGWWGI